LNSILFRFLVQVFKEIHESYSENTDKQNCLAMSLHIHPALHLTNLLPIDIQCSVDVINRNFVCLLLIEDYF